LVCAFLTKTLNNLIRLPKTHNCKFSLIGRRLNKQVIHNNSTFITFDVKDLFVNIPIIQTLCITEYFMTLSNMSATLQGRLVDILKTVLAQNYFNSRKLILSSTQRRCFGYCYIRIDGGNIPTVLRTPYFKTFGEEQEYSFLY
jgi:hypothetical protein